MLSDSLGGWLCHLHFYLGTTVTSVSSSGTETNTRKKPLEDFLFSFELCHVSLQAMSTWKSRLTKSLKLPSRRMHSFPCSALLACFGNTRENATFDQSSSTDTHSAIYVQPMAKAGRHPSPKVEEKAPEKRRDSGMHSEQNGTANGSNSKHTAVQPVETPEDLARSLHDDCEAITFQTSIPRPSIIDMPKVSELSNCCYR